MIVISLSPILNEFIAIFLVTETPTPSPPPSTTHFQISSSYSLSDSIVMAKPIVTPGK